MKPARQLTTKQIRLELDELDDQWKQFRKDLEGMSGSPGEWMVERMDELETELKRRGESTT